MFGIALLTVDGLPCWMKGGWTWLYSCAATTTVDVVIGERKLRCLRNLGMSGMLRATIGGCC